MAEPSVHLQPADVVGIVQRGLFDANQYLSATAPLVLNIPALVEHLDRMNEMLARLHKMQSEHRQAANEDSAMADKPN